MERYFFHVYDGTETLDLEGLELSGIHAALAIAIGAIQRLADRNAHDGMVSIAIRIDIGVNGGQVVASVHFKRFAQSLTGTARATQFMINVAATKFARTG